MSMKTLLFTECVDFVGSACKPFAGTKKYVSTGAVDVDHINDSDTEIVDYEGKPSRANLEAMAGDVLFAKMQGTKKTLLIDPILANHIYSTGFCAVRAKEGILTERCLYHLLTSEMFLSQKDKNCSGATQKAITNAGLGKIVIHVPSIEEQDDIAYQLDAVISIITKRQQELAALEELIKARFVEMFGDPIFNEKGFETKAGSDVFNLSNGKFVPESKRFEAGIPVYGGNGISWYTDDTLFANDTIVVGRVGFQSGNVHLVKGPLWISDNAMYVSSINDDGFDLRFLYFVMEHIDFTRYQDAGDLKKITQKPFMSMFYIRPPVDLQLEYIAFVEQVDKSIIVVQKAMDEAQLLFDSLMQEYFG